MRFICITLIQLSERHTPLGSGMLWFMNIRLWKTRAVTDFEKTIGMLKWGS